MTDLIRGLDADEDLTPYVRRLMAANIQFVGRYLKNLTLTEALALSAAGIRIVAIYETTGRRALLGAAAGGLDGTSAALLMRAVGAPPGAGVQFTVDVDVNTVQVETVVNYFNAAKATMGVDYVAGLYGSGLVLEACKPSLPWLAGAMGWQGSRDFDAAGTWVLKQGPTLTHGGTWAGIDWPDLGFAYDPDVASTDAYGGFLAVAG